MSTARRLAAPTLVFVAWTLAGLDTVPSRSREAVDDEPPARERLAEAHRRDGADSAAVADAALHLASVLLRGSGRRLDEAAELGHRAAAIRERIHGPDHPEVADALECEALVRWLRGDVAGMRPIVDRLVAIRERHPADEVALAKGLHYLSEIQRVEGDLGAALQTRERLGPILERNDGPGHSDLVAHLLALARLREETADLPGAIAATRRAVALAESAEPSQRAALARALTHLGARLLLGGDPRGAEAPLERAVAMLERLPDEQRGLLAGSLTQLASVRFETGRPEAARRLLSEAEAIERRRLGDGHVSVARILAAAGTLERRLGDFAASRGFLERAVAIQEREAASSHEDLGRTILELARLDRAEGHVPAAIEGACRSARLERTRFRWASEGLTEREALAKGRASASGVDLALAWSSALARKGAIDDRAVALVLDTWIRSRALVLDTLAGRRRALAFQAGPGVNEAVGRLRGAQGELHRLLRVVEPAPADLPERIERARAAADRAERELAALSREFRRTTVRRDAGLDEVREALPERTALVSYARFEAEGGGYVAFVLKSGDEPPVLVPLGSSAPIDADVAAWERAIASDPRLSGVERSESEFRLVSRRLAERIWEPLEPHLGPAATVLFVPAGSLHRLNVATLLARDGTYLVESETVFQALSAERDLVGLEASRADGRGILAIGDPDFVRGSEGPFRFEPIPGSRREAEAVVSAWPEGEAVLLTGAAASEVEFARRAPSFRVVHLATHAILDEGGTGTGSNPLRLSGLALSGAGRASGSGGEADADDGILTAEEIARIDLHAVEWAVLSGCDTAGGVLDPREGILGLGRAFQIAGARTLILSLWPVEDEAARHWMRELYAARLGGATTAEAVRRAHRHLLAAQRRETGTTHPYYWGSFVAMGDWR